MELEWRIFPGHTTLQILQEIQKINDGLGLWTRTIPRENYLHVEVQRHQMKNQNNESVCLANLSTVGCCAKRFAKERNATDIIMPGGRWDKVADPMMGAQVKVVNNGAVTNLCDEFGHPLIDSEKNYACVEQSESTVAPADLLNFQRLFEPMSKNKAIIVQPHRESADLFGWGTFDPIECRCKFCLDMCR